MSLEINPTYDKDDPAILTVSFCGKLDTNTAPQAEAEINQLLQPGQTEPPVTKLVLDFSRLDYLSSAGLAILLSLQKHFGRSHHLSIANPNDLVMDIFEASGFTRILKIT